MIFGYMRISTSDDRQKFDMQEDALKKAGCEKIFFDKASGSKQDRPELQKMLEQLRPSDCVICYKLDRISRSTRHLIEIADFFEKNQISFKSTQDQIDTSTAMGRFFFRMMASIAELEREITIERIRSGMQSAKARNIPLGAPKLESKVIKMALKMYDTGFKPKEICQTVGIGRSTLYKYLKEREDEKLTIQ